MKAITLHQPWAALVALEAKRYETRSWQTSHRGLLAIHAGKTWNKDLQTIADAYPSFSLALAYCPKPLPLGAIVCVCYLSACIPTDDLFEKISPREAEFGNYASGRFGWRLQVVWRPEHPIPCSGKQGLWNWDAPQWVLDQMPKSLFTRAPHKSSTNDKIGLVQLEMF